MMIMKRIAVLPVVLCFTYKIVYRFLCIIVQLITLTIFGVALALRSGMEEAIAPPHRREGSRPRLSNPFLHL